MLTIRHIAEDGRESLVSVASVSYEHRPQLLVGCGPNFIEVVRFESGHVYVMNDNGKTVAVYNLDKKQEQANGRTASRAPRVD